MKAFITGINGQDGSYLAEYLLSLGYQVSGMVRRNSVSENQSSRLNSIKSQIYVDYGDVTDFSSIMSLLKTSQPDEIYHLAAQSHVRISFVEPLYTSQVNAIGTLNLLEAMRMVCPKARLYNAASSEMFGNEADVTGSQSEATRMNPVSPYGISKLFAYNAIRNYRSSYGLFLSSGILFNHESPRRASNFVTTKVVKGAIAISKGKASKLELGNLYSYRDWGHAYDYVRAMHKILNYHRPEDFVIATGKTRSVADLCQYVFNKLNLNYKDHVISDPKYLRPEELHELKGNSGKAYTYLKWSPTYTFESMIDEMIEYWSNEN